VPHLQECLPSHRSELLWRKVYWRLSRGQEKLGKQKQKRIVLLAFYLFWVFGLGWVFVVYLFGGVAWGFA
jgi:hypothetical protein